MLYVPAGRESKLSDMLIVTLTDVSLHEEVSFIFLS